MLYISTRNINDSYTAYRALHEEFAPDGGLYVPFRIPVITAEELIKIKSQAVSDTIAMVLNLFFGLRVTGDDVAEVLGNTPVFFQTINQNVVFAELWHTPDGNCSYYVNGLYHKISGKLESPKGWAHIAIQIALLFGIYGANHADLREFDMAITVNDFADLTAVLYAKEMGLPVNRIVCACNEDGILWDLVNRGEFSSSKNSAYTECLIYKYFGESGVKHYLNACSRKANCDFDENSLQELIDELHPAVVSFSRVDTVISSMYSSNSYRIDRDSALAYGGLQDYRASTGANKQTLIISANRPEHMKE